MKKRLLFLAFVLMSISVKAQKQNYQKIFNDGDKESKFQIGIDAMTLLGGTPNIYANIKLTPSFVLNVGVGTSPFNYLFEVSGLINGEVETITKDIKSGYYYKANIRYYMAFTEKSKFDIFGQYYAFGFDHWSTPSTLRESVITKSRLALNTGVSFDIPGRFNLDIEYGLYVGVFKETPNVIVDENIDYGFGYIIPNPDYIEPVKEFVYGLRLGLGLTFAL